LVLTNVIGRWALMVSAAIGIAVGLMRCRAEAEQEKQTFGDHRLEGSFELRNPDRYE
jgi:hypothetical protein